MKYQWNTWFSLSKYFLLALFIPTALLLMGSVITSIAMDIPIAVFTKDPLSFAALNPLTGLLSNIGMIFWSFTVAICLLTAFVLKDVSKRFEASVFLFFSGLITLVLLLDDFFMMHEVIYPQWIGIPEKIVMISYGVMILSYLYLFRHRILKSDITLLVLFLSMFGVSAVIDLFIPDSLFDWHYLFEDGPKFIGIISWFGYLAFICVKELKLTLVK